MAEKNLIKNTKIEYVEDNTNGGDPNLVFSFPNPLDEEEPQLRTIRLFTTDRKTKAISEDTIAQTEKILQTNLNDESITFAADPKQAKDTDIRHWVKAHKGENIDNVYQNGQYYQLGLGTGSSNFGGSNHLKTYHPDKATEPYNPAEHRMSVFNAQTEELQQAIKNNDTSHNDVYQKRNGNYGVAFNNHIIHDVVFESANAFDTETEDTNRIEFLQNLIDAYSIVKKEEANKVTLEEIETFKEKVEKEPGKHGYKELMRFIGGLNAPLLPKKLAPIAKDALAVGTRMTVAFYIKNPHNGYIYRTSKQSVNPDITGFEPNFLEFFTGDASRKDVTDYVSNLEIIDFEDAAKETVEKQLDGSIKNLDNEDFGDVPTTILNFLKTLLVGREINLTSNIPNDGDVSRMGCYVQRPIGKVTSMNTEDIKIEQPKPSEVADIKDEDLPFNIKASESEDKPKNKNPFAPADEEDNDDEDATPSTPKERKGSNPFDV